MSRLGHCAPRRAGIASLLLSTSLVIGPALAREPRDGVPDRAEASSGARGSRLFLDAAEIAALRRRIASSERLRTGVERLLEEAREGLEARWVPESEAEGGSGQHGNYFRPSQQIARLGEALGFAWAWTGEARYAEKLREGLLYYARYRRWAGKAFFGWDPPWHSELSTAFFLLGYATGLDFLGDSLSAQQRGEIVEATVRLGIEPTIEDWVGSRRRVHALDSMGHNWWSVCVGAAGVAALAVEKDEKRARAWADRVAEAYPEWFGYRGNVLQNKAPTFDPSGGYYESVGYASFALHYFHLFRRAYRRARGGSGGPLDSIAELRGTADFILHTSYPRSDSVWTVNFGDQDYRSAVSSLVVRSAALDADARRAAALRWYLERTSPEIRSIHALAMTCRGEPEPVDTEGPAGELPPPEMPLSRLWPSMGWAVARDSWADDTTLLALKCGDTWNHAHADAGSFLLWRGGRALIIDSGSCSYGRREYVDYYCQSRAHNVVTLDGEGQSRADHGRGVKLRGRIPVLLAGGSRPLRLFFADATGPTAHLFARNHRVLLWAGRVILVIDELLAHRPGRIEWLLHPGEEAAELDRATGVRVGEGEAGATVQSLWPEGASLEWRDGLRDHEPDVHERYLAVLAPEAAREAKLLNAITLGAQRQIAFERLSGPHFLGVAWEEGGVRTEVRLNRRADGSRMHRNSNAVLGPFESDAYLLVTQRPAAAPESPLERCLVLGASYLRRAAGGETIIDSLSKIDAIWEPRSDPPSLWRTPRGSARVRLGGAGEARAIRVNGERVEPVERDQLSGLLEVDAKR